MARRFAGDRLVLATHNPGKVAEFKALMAPLGITVASAAEHGLSEPEETGTTFVENAGIKALVAALATGLPALADDSGITVAALDGAPGVHSARWAGPGRDFTPAMARVVAAVAANGNDGAAFVCALCLAWPDGHAETVEGRVAGTITDAARGEGGFGYDPIFVPEGETRTFAEMTGGEKAKLSHRARALDAMLARCFA